jgi:hypothetical protein
MMPSWRLLLLLAVSLTLAAAQEQAGANHKYQPKARNGVITYAANTSGTFQVGTLFDACWNFPLSQHQHSTKQFILSGSQQATWFVPCRCCLCPVVRPASNLANW